MLRGLSRRGLPARRASLPAARRLVRLKSTVADDIEVDDLCIPTQPTWSVREQIAASPRPSITPETLAHLHKLSALIPPSPHTLEHQKLTKELEDMVSLVHAVRDVDVSSVKVEGEVPDGRIWQVGRGMQVRDYTKEGGMTLGLEGMQKEEEEPEGKELLRLAERTVDEEYYVVEREGWKR